MSGNSGLMRGGLGVLVIGLSAMSVGCAEDEARPPLSAGCTSNCPKGGSGSTTPDAGGGSAGTGGTGGTSSSSTTIEGEFFVYDDQFAPGAIPVLDAVEVQAPAPDGSTLSDNFDAPNGFLLPGVLAAPGVWIGARTITGSLELLPTVQIYDTTTSGTLFLPLVQRATLELISNLLTQPVVFNDNAAHVVMHFVDPAGAPLAGVSVVANPGAERIVYDAAGSWSDGESATSDAGYAVLLNIGTSADFPGSEQPFSVQTAMGEVLAVIAPVAAGTVTLFDVAVPDP